MGSPAPTPQSYSRPATAKAVHKDLYMGLLSHAPGSDEAVALINGTELRKRIGSATYEVIQDIIQNRPLNEEKINALVTAYAVVHATMQMRSSDVNFDNYASTTAGERLFGILLSRRSSKDLESKLGHVQAETLEVSHALETALSEIKGLGKSVGEQVGPLVRTVETYRQTLESHNRTLTAARSDIGNLREVLDRTGKSLSKELGEVKKEQSTWRDIYSKWFPKEEDQQNYFAVRGGTALGLGLSSGLGLHFLNTINKAHEAFKPIAELPIYGTLTLGEIAAGVGMGIVGYGLAMAATRPPLSFYETPADKPVNEYVKIEQLTRDGPLSSMKAQYRITTKIADGSNPAEEIVQLGVKVKGGPYDISGEPSDIVDVKTGEHIEIPGIPRISSER